MTTIKYRGFIGNLDVDLETKLVLGKVQNIRALLMYQGVTIDDAIADFHVAVDEYLSDCEARGIQPEQSYNGVFQVRVQPETHFALATAAAEQQIALNTLIVDVLEEHVAARRAAPAAIDYGDRDQTLLFVEALMNRPIVRNYIATHIRDSVQANAQTSSTNVLFSSGGQLFQDAKITRIDRYRQQKAN